MRKTAISMAAGLCLSILSALPGMAQDLTPVGQWQSATGESRYEVTFCGGAKLCARLVWLRSDVRTADNLRYLNKYVVRGATPTEDNKWSGTVLYAGESVGGSMTLLSPDKLRLSGCKLVMCQTLEFERI